MMNTTRFFALALLLPAAGCSGSFGLSLTAAVTTDGVTAEPTSRCTFSSGSGLGAFSIEAANAGVSAAPFDVDAPYTTETLDLTISVDDVVVAEDSWYTIDITPDFLEHVTTTRGSSDIVVTVQGVDDCG